MPVLLLSTHAPPITLGNPEDCTVPQREGSRRPNIHTSPVLQEYTTHMCGIDIADHLRGNYSYCTCTHKWWHKVFFFLWDLSMTSIYIMYLEILVRLDKDHEAITHVHFRNGMAQALTHSWLDPNPRGALDLPRVLTIHCPRWTIFRRKCMRCRERTQYFCYLCGRQFMCVKEGCYEMVHTSRTRDKRYR
jgi:hypothetical protein